MTDDHQSDTQRDRLRAENERLREALKPFADACDAVGVEDDDPEADAWETPYAMDVKVGDFHRAFEVLSAQPDAQQSASNEDEALSRPIDDYEWSQIEEMLPPTSDSTPTDYQRGLLRAAEIAERIPKDKGYTSARILGAIGYAAAAIRAEAKGGDDDQR